MSRSVAWRNKPTNLIAQMIPVASQMKLYLVSQIGPTSFLFKDQHDNKFKVNIGFKISCSCAVVTNDHCIHTLFVMLKKFRVPENNPILWQASYIDSELEGLIQLKYREIKKVTVPKFVPKRKAKHYSQKEDEDFPPLGQDVTCPICFDDMQGQCYSTCSTCKKSIHSECLKVWMRQKQYDGVAVTCPMCRSQFHNANMMVMRDLQRWSKRFTTHKGSHCKTCNTRNIQGLLYKCLMCQNVELCKLCYESHQHSEHMHFFVKQMSSEPWRSAPLRRARKKMPQQYRPQTLNYQNISSSYPLQSSQFIVSLFPTLKQEQTGKGIDSLGIVGNDMLNKQLCHKCHTPGDQSMKKINCGHSVHATCLHHMIQSKQYLCDIDGTPICPGYLTAMNIAIPSRSTRKQGRTTDCAFIRKGQQIEKIKRKLGAGFIGLSSEIKQTKTQQSQHFSVGVTSKVDRFNQKNPKPRQNSSNKFNAKSKDRNFRIMKKTIMQRRLDAEPFGVGVGFGSPMMVTGIKNNQNSYGPLLPKPPSNQLHRSTRGRPPHY